MHLRLPHPLVLLLGGVAVAAALTWVIPGGFYERHTDPVTQRSVVIAGTYARTKAAPVGSAAGAVLVAAVGAAGIILAA